MSSAMLGRPQRLNLVDRVVVSSARRLKPVRQPQQCSGNVPRLIGAQFHGIAGSCGRLEMDRRVLLDPGVDVVGRMNDLGIGPIFHWQPLRYIGTFWDFMSS